MISQQLSEKYKITDPWDIVTLFENKLADYAGSKYAVCVDSCSNAIFLCLKYLNITGITITIPARTYPSTPMQCIHTGNRIKFVDTEWSGDYFLEPTPIVDGATKFKKGMYIPDTYYCVSFHHRKTLKIGKGGVILTDDAQFASWARPMIYDGRHKNILHSEDNYECIGYHMYMTPEEAAKGLLLFEDIPEYNQDTGNNSVYKDLRQQRVFDPYVD
jgi:dTDP-4-amino-4,6-dideoxygalactose transaminase